MTDEEPDYEGTRFHTFDKIDYRRTIHKLVERCLLNSQSPEYNGYVQDLIDSIDFDLDRYPLRKLIDRKSNQIIENIRKEKQEWSMMHPDEWSHPMKRGIKRAEWDKKYYRELFKYVHQLLAARGLYLKSGKTLSGGKQMKDPE